ncbi:MAG: hypothetical protein P4L57_11360 [Rhizomicrobium sp.]|nr:hypothetical protein [Rhizomicrobium sp.]
MTLSKESLGAYVDGSLPPEEMGKVEIALRTDPDAQAYVAQQRALLKSLRGSFDPILDMPVPPALSALLSPRRHWGDAWRRWGLWTALPSAVALACGVLITLSLQGGDIVASQGKLMARGELAQALTQRLAADDSANRTSIGLSFRAKNGHYCRTFTTTSLAGVACHDERGWAVAAVGGVVTEAHTAYRPAGSTMPDFVRSAVTTMLAGDPLDAAAERRQRDAGWH